MRRLGDSASDRADSPPPAGPPAQGGPTSLKSGPDRVPSSGEPDRTENASPSYGVEAIDAIIQSFWKDDRAADSQERLSDIVRLSDGLHELSFPIRLADWPHAKSLPPDRIIREPRVSSQPVRSSFVAARRIGVVIPRVIDKNKPEPAAALAFLVVATMAHEWVHPRRWHRTIVAGRTVRRRILASAAIPVRIAPKFYPAPIKVRFASSSRRDKNMTAQGNALGNQNDTEPPSPERADKVELHASIAIGKRAVRNENECVLRPFQGTVFPVFRAPGRCPGLACDCP